MAWQCPLCGVEMGNIPNHQCPGLNKAADDREEARLINWHSVPQLLSQFSNNAPITNHYDGPIPKKYHYAIVSWLLHHGNNPEPNWEQFKAKYTYVDLEQLSNARHLELIDMIWSECVSFHPYNTNVSAMDDPGQGNFPSSATKPNTPVFQQKGICYRCDKRQPANVLQDGFRPLYSIAAPEPIQGTIMQNRTTGAGGVAQSAGYWAANRDVVSQTSICVSRSLRGCGKFPEPFDTGLHYFYAFKFDLGKQGFDTEARQVQTGGRWLPGEKAFPSVAINDVIASCMIKKLGSDPPDRGFERYSYQIINKEWTFYNNATFWDKSYLTAELNALTNGENMRIVIVQSNQDFVRGQ